MECDCLSFSEVKFIVRTGLKILVADTVVIKRGYTINEYGALCVLVFVKFIN